MKDQAQANPSSFGNEKVVELALDNCDVLATADPTPGDGYPAGGQSALAGESDANAGETSGLTDRGAMPAQVGQRIELRGPSQAPQPGQYVTVTDRASLGRWWWTRRTPPIAVRGTAAPHPRATVPRA
jgi:hypothetical protein